MHSESETNKLKCLGSWKILLTFSDSPIRQFSCLKKHKKCGLVMIKLAHKAPQECGNRNVVMALHDIELKHFFCQYWSEKLEWQLWIYSGSWTRGLPLISFSLSHTLSLSFSFSGSGHVLRHALATMSPSRRRTERSPFMVAMAIASVITDFTSWSSVVKLAWELLK